MNRSSSRLARIVALATLLVSPVFAWADAAGDLHEAYAKAMKARYATETVSTDESGKQTRSSAKFDTSERIHITTETGGFIVLPEGTWMQAGPGGAWQKPPFDLGGMIKQLVPKTLDDMRANAKNVRDEGTKSIDGANLRAISYDYESKIMGIAVATHTIAYLDGSGRIVRSESDGVAMGRKTRSVQTLRYDDSIRVSAPE
ncbi:MAG: hypothetical protein J0L88_03010 [Xanthomonadales bacterium]|nr:hypothetical protein [Xanthomonadales bacterium]